MLVLIIFEDFNFFRKMASHSLVGLENGAMLLLRGKDWGSGSFTTGIWELKEKNGAESANFRRFET
jgi:hypothetical protein